jgi:ribosomal protein L17
MAAPKGNTFAAKGKLFEGVIKRALMANDGAKLRSIVEKIIEKAEDGDMMAARELLDRVDGKPKQQVELSGDAENPVTVNFTHAAADLLGKIRGDAA